MKKILSLIMALTLVMGVNAAFKPLNKKALRNAPRLEQVQKQTAAQPATVKHAHKNLRHIDRNVIRKAPMASQTVIFAPADFADQGGEGGSSVSTTKDGITISTDKGWGHRAYNQDTQENDGAPDQFRVYAGGKLTISATSTITKIEFQVSESKYDGGLSSSYTPNATSWTETMSKQARITAITVTLGEGGDTPPTPPTPSGDVTITGLNYVDAIFYADETNGDYWSFDFYKELNEEGYILAPYVYFICNESTTSGTKIAGTWTAYDAGYFATDDEESGIYTDEENPVGSLTVTCVEQGIYNFVGSFVGTDGKTYTWTLNNMEVYAYNGDTYEDITLTDGGEPTPVGDTIPLTTIDGLEFGYYGSYSEEGAYNYTLTVYNSQSEEYVPQASFDIYTEQLNVFPGTYSAEAGNLGLDYSAYFPTADSEGEYLSAATIEITDGEDGMIHVTGVFITEAGQAYSIDLTAAPYVYDADYPYEPEDPIVLNLTAVSMEEDAEYGSEGMIYAYLYMEDESYVSLTYRALSAIQHLQDGTYPIADLEEESSYLTGYDFYGWPAGSYYEDVNGNVYYFVSGTVTVESLDGATTITINATSAHGSSITVTYSGETPQPSGDHTIVIADYGDINFTTLDGAYTVASAQNGGSSAPVYNADGKDARLYAQNTFTLTSNNGAMTEIVFNISDKGLTRQADIAVSAGSITSYDMTNAKVTWVGNATEVVFTVGEKNTHGTDAPSKAGQFDFTSIDIVNPATGLFDVNVNANVNKFMYNGNVMINVNGVIYNVLGAEIKR